jgi:predicted phosphohydrolase
LAGDKKEVKIYALGDLHLSFKKLPTPGFWEEADEYKPMGEINPAWTNHTRLIYENWVKIVQPEDLVLVPGDISWAMRLEEAKSDLSFLGLLPGKIVGVQGNHDYWWQSISRVRTVLPPNIFLIQNDHVWIKGLALCGTRGWTCPGASHFQKKDGKIYHREVIRLENSLKSIKLPAKEIIVLMHYMPTNEKHEFNHFIEVLQKYAVTTVVYAHLHDQANRYRLPDKAWGINFYLASADYLGFKPYFIKEWF